MFISPIFFCSIVVFSAYGANTFGADEKPEVSTGTMTETRQYYGTGTYGHNKVPPFGAGYRCPLCDSSVYPYCGERMLHDACCCTEQHIHDTPHQCRLADCRFLHANSCREHRLIASCCCSDDYRSLLKALRDH